MKKKMREWKKALGVCFLQKSKFCKDDGNTGIAMGMLETRRVLIGKRIYILRTECDEDDELRESWHGEPCRRNSDKEKQRRRNSKQRLLVCKVHKAWLFSL
ncbi:hypothetical protein DITRI_Ditri19aG0189200 [Diplodiscus trichospermus]